MDNPICIFMMLSYVIYTIVTITNIGTIGEQALFVESPQGRKFHEGIHVSIGSPALPNQGRAGTGANKGRSERVFFSQ